MAFLSTPARDAQTLLKSLLSIANDETVEKRDRIAAARAWVEVEAYKRELRGVPRLSSHSLSELVHARKANARDITTDHEPIELDEPAPTTAASQPATPKESLSNPQTVTAPPAPETP